MKGLSKLECGHVCVVVLPLLYGLEKFNFETLYNNACAFLLSKYSNHVFNFLIVIKKRVRI